MKKIFKNKLWISVGCILLCAIGLFLGIKGREDRLSDKQIMALREQYPVASTASYGLGHIIPRTMDEMIDAGTIHTFVYAEVIGEYQTYYKRMATGDEFMDEKLVGNGLGVMKFFECPISIIEDTEGIYQPGDVITITSNAMYKDMYPKLSEGMKVIIPLSGTNGDVNREFYAVAGMYYVTDNGYAISAYDENTLASTTYSGLRVSALLEDLKELIK